MLAPPFGGDEDTDDEEALFARSISPVAMPTAASMMLGTVVSGMNMMAIWVKNRTLSLPFRKSSLG